MAATKLLSAYLVVAALATLDAAGGPLAQSMNVGGVERHYLLAVPANVDNTRPIPLGFVFHGAGYGGVEMAREHPFAALGEKHGFISVFPDGLDNRWNGNRIYDPFSKDDKSDDVVFVSKIIDVLETRCRIDARRIFATGSSNGAIFCYTLAARLSERIAAIAPVSGSLGEDVPRRFPPENPVSVVSFNGTADPLVP
jgi:polyhydroxybutyrate depolymerase